MGLDDFMDSGSTKTKSASSSNDSSSGTTKQTQQTHKSGNTEPYKVVGVGWQKKIFKSEEDWQEVVDFIHENSPYHINEILKLGNEVRYEYLHKCEQAVTKGFGHGFVEDTRECLVCEHEFVFPKDWDFSEFKGKSVCNDHTIEDVINAHTQNKMKEFRDFSKYDPDNE